MPPYLKMGGGGIARRKEQHTFPKCAKEPVLQCHDQKKKIRELGSVNIL